MSVPITMEFRNVDVYFIYPFSLPAMYFLRDWDAIWKQHGQDNGATVSSYLPQYIRLHAQGFRMYPFGNKPLPCTIEMPNHDIRLAPHSAEIQNEVILCKNGGGCCAFHLSITPETNKNFTVPLTSNFLLLNDYGAHFSIKQTDGDNRSDMSSGKKLFQLFHDATMKIASDIFAKKDNEPELGYQERLMSYMDRQLFAEQDFLSPYIFTVLRLDRGTPYDYLNTETQEGKAIEPNVQALASLLIRTYGVAGNGADQISESYLEHSTYITNTTNNTGFQLANLFPFNHLFINIHYRSCLVVHGDYSGNKSFENYGTQYIDGAIQSVEMARIQWYLDLLLNAKIDKLLANNATKLARSISHEQEGTTSSDDLENILSSVINIRTTASIISNDPVSYGHAAGSFSILFSRMRELFRLDQLESSINIKLQALDRMYYDLRELERINLLKATR